MSIAPKKKAMAKRNIAALRLENASVSDRKDQVGHRQST